MAATDMLQANGSGCGFEAPADGDAWTTAEHPPRGTGVQCPECGNTDLHSER